MLLILAMTAPQRFKEQPHVAALVRSRDFVHIHLEHKIDYLLPLLLQASVLTESKISRIKLGKFEAERVERLLSFVKFYNFDKFIDFLEVLRDEKEDKDLWCCLERLIDEVKDAPASELNLSPDYEKRFNDLKWFVASQHALSFPTSHSQPYFPVETALINKSNMMFHSSVHGVSITFQSLPIEEFKVSLTVLDPSLFKFSDELELCTMIVDITTKPQIPIFEADSISISIPHCAVVSCRSDADCLSVRTLSGSSQLTEKVSIDFSMGEEIKADFGDGYCARFNISHFTLFAGVKRRRFVGPSLNTCEVRNPPAKRPNKRTNDFTYHCVAQDHLIWRFNEVSLTQKVDSGVYRQVKCYFPLRRPDNFPFVILCYMDLPSLEKNATMEAARICKCSEHELISQSFTITQSCSSLLYTVDRCGLFGWTIQPMEKFLQIISAMEKDLFSCSRQRSSKILSTVVDVKQIASAERSSSEIMCKFNIMSDWADNTRNQDSTIVSLQLHNDVFSSMSELRSLLTQYLHTAELSSVYLLDVTNCNEHYQFLAYMSYHMGTKWRMIGRCLKIDEAKLDTIDTNHSMNESSEKAFQMLLTWATSSNTTPSLKSLLDALKTCNYSIHINCSIDDSLANAEKQIICLQVSVFILYDICHKNTITKWLFIGRFLGLENHQLERILADYNGVVERSYEMFKEWISSFGASATYKCLARAFFLVHQLDSTCVNAAWIKIKRQITTLSSTGQQIHWN